MATAYGAIETSRESVFLFFFDTEYTKLFPYQLAMLIQLEEQENTPDIPTRWLEDSCAIGGCDLINFLILSIKIRLLLFFFK